MYHFIACLILTSSIASAYHPNFARAPSTQTPSRRMQPVAAGPFEGLFGKGSPKSPTGLKGSGSKPSIKLSKVAITGASGLVGTELTKRLEAKNVKVLKITTKLTRKSGSGGSDSDTNTIQWNPSTGYFGDINALEGVDAIVHLAGENVASGDGPLAIIGRWSEAKKAAILGSRVDGTRLIVETMSKLKRKPKTFISASAVGYYGYEDQNVVFDDSLDSKKGAGFLADVVEAWEREALVAQKQLGIRTACLRFAPVFSPKAGILAKLLPIFNLGAGGVLGNGLQGFSWVTLNDAVRAIEYTLDKASLSGPINVCSPNPVTNAEFTSAMGNALFRPVIVPVPEFAVKIIFGEMGEEMLLGGQKAVPTKLTKSGFTCEDSEIEEAIKSML